jgi:hypothetical protein
MERHKTMKTINLFCRVIIITLPLLVALAFIQIKIHDLFCYFKEQSLARQISIPEKKETIIEQVEPKKRIDSSAINYLPDGTIHIVYTEYSAKPRADHMKQIYDSNFNLIWEGNDKEQNIYSGRYLAFNFSIPTYNLNNDIYRFSSVYFSNTQSLILPAQEDMVKNGYWKYNHYTNCFEGFDKNKNIIGYCGAEAFVSDKSKLKKYGEIFFITPAWLNINNDGPLVLLGDKHEIYEINFGTQSIQSLIKLPEKQIKKVWIYGWWDFFPKLSPSVESVKYRPLIMCQTQDDAIFLILRDPNETIQTRLPDKIKSRNIRFVATYENIYIRVIDNGLNPPEEIAKDYSAYSEWLDHRSDKPVTNSDQLYTVNPSGSIQLLNNIEWIIPARVNASDSYGYSLLYPDKEILRYIAISSPVFYDFLYKVFNRFVGYPFINSNYESHMVNLAIADTLDYSSPFYNPYCYLISILMAGIVFIHAWPRRKSMAGFIGWVIFAALFNIVGLLVYLALNFTPTIKCHKCHKKRGLNTPECPRCGAELSTMTPDKLSIITEA